MSIDPKAAARRTRGVVEDWREPPVAANARRWLLSSTLDRCATLCPQLHPNEFVGDLLSMPLPTLRSTALVLAISAAAPSVHEATKARFASATADDVRDSLFVLGRTLAKAGDARRVLAQASAREWLLRAVAAAVGLGTRLGKSQEPAVRQRAALNRLNPVGLVKAARATSREERFANALADLARELAAGLTPSAVNYRGL